MSESLHPERYRLATDCLCEFMNALRLNGEPLAQSRRYDPVEVAHAGGQYLKVVGVTRLHHPGLSHQPDGYLAEIWEGNAQDDAAYDLPSVMLGTVVGEAMFNPDSVLDVEQKREIFVDSILILQKASGIDGRGNPEHFVDIAVTCAEDYADGTDLTKLRQKLHRLREELDPNFSRWRRRAQIVGGALLAGMACYGPPYGTDVYPADWGEYPDEDDNDK